MQTAIRTSPSFRTDAHANNDLRIPTSASDNSSSSIRADASFSTDAGARADAAILADPTIRTAASANAAVGCWWGLEGAGIATPDIRN